DPRVKVVEQPNGGLSAARTLGTSFAQARYLTFVDSDDLVAGVNLQYAVERLEETGSDYALLPYRQFRDPDQPSPTPPWVAEFYGDESRTVVAHEHPEVL